MSKLTEKANLIPAEDLQGCESWQMPMLDGGDKVVSVSGKSSRRTERNEHDITPEPLTASKIEAIRQQAHEEGLALGKREGLRLAQAEVNEKLAQLDRIMGQLMHPLAEQDADLEKALVKLAGSIAQTVVQTSIELDGDRLLKIIQQALAQLPDASQHIRVIVHPKDAELIKRASAPASEDWKIIADASLLNGGCIIKTDYSYVDFTLEKQFQLTMQEMVKQRMAHHATEEVGDSGKGVIE
ncbi:MAG: flagellar assembly protein FliH [Pseudomonadales bacterium]|nr:flagellar assembly protein FliH [Pseudomonadales bacterium]